MSALFVLLGLGLVAGLVGLGGGGDDDEPAVSEAESADPTSDPVGQDVPDLVQSAAQTFTDDDDVVVDESFRTAIEANLADLVANGEITQAEADADLAEANFVTGPMNVSTGDGDDEVAGGAGNDQIDVGAGDDFVLGGAGNDFIKGGVGNDELLAVLGSDSVVGNQGNDFILTVDQDGVTPDSVSGGFGSDQLVVDQGDTVKTGMGRDEVTVDVFSGVEAGYQVVTITDFDPEKDTIQLEGSFDLLSTGSTGGADSPVSVEDLDDGTGATVSVNGIPVIRVLGGQGLMAEDVRLSF